jgi:TetR/AcrR family transcriptional regulator of autoinduction and epiphytic fitness
MNTPSTRYRKKIAIRDQIIAKGIELFTEHGIHNVTVDQIAATADIGKGTVYNYFQTKEDIIVAFLVRFEPEVQKRVKSLYRSNRPLAVTLTAYVLQQLRLKERYHPFVRVFLAQMFLRTEQFFPYIVEMQKTIDPPLEELFTKLQERGAIRPDVAIPGLIQIFKTMHLGLTSLWALEGPPFKATQGLVKQEMKLFCEGLETRT